MSLSNWNVKNVGEPMEPPLGPYNYAILQGSGEEHMGEDNSSAEVIYLMDWDQRAQFQDDLLGSAAPAGNVLTRTLPEEHPLYRNFFAVETNAKPLGAADGFVGNQNLDPNYPLAMINASFRPLDYDVAEDGGEDTELYRFVSRTYSYVTEYLTIQGQMAFVTRTSMSQPNPALDTTPGMNVGYAEKTYIWHWVPWDGTFNVPNEDIIVSLLGTCNATTFDGNPPQTVLFSGVEPTLVRPRLRTGDYYWTIGYKMLIKNNGSGISGETAGVNYIFDTLYKRWDLVTDNGLSTGGRIYPTGQLNDLFTWG